VVPAVADQQRLGLTSKIPVGVRQGCRKVARTYKGRVYCPPLVPAGKAFEEYVGGKNRRPGDAARTYALDFTSPSLQHIGGKPVDANGGHWVAEAGVGSSLRDDLGLWIKPRFRHGRIRVARSRLDGQRVAIYRLASACCFEVYLAGHDSVVWRRAGVTYIVSIHGYPNRPRVIAMARALIRLQQVCGTRSAPAGACALVLQGRR
jgi:hypothetical protein